MSIEDLLDKIPPTINRFNTMAWLVVTPDNQGMMWTAGYQTARGAMIQEWYFEGATATEALGKLVEHIETYELVAEMLR